MAAGVGRIDLVEGELSETVQCHTSFGIGGTLCVTVWKKWTCKMLVQRVLWYLASPIVWSWDVWSTS